MPTIKKPGKRGGLPGILVCKSKLQVLKVGIGGKG